MVPLQTAVDPTAHGEVVADAECGIGQQTLEPKIQEVIPPSSTINTPAEDKKAEEAQEQKQQGGQAASTPIVQVAKEENQQGEGEEAVETDVPASTIEETESSIHTPAEDAEQAIEDEDNAPFLNKPKKQKLQPFVFRAFDFARQIPTAN